MWAGVRLLSCVYSDVVGEQPGAGEGLLADVALVAPHVGLHVHGQGRHAHVELLADVARLGCLRGELAVRLLVSRQVGAGGKVLSTFQTFMDAFLLTLEARSTIVEKQGVFGEGLDIGGAWRD